MILKRLRQETGQRHAALELKLPLLAPELSKEDYRLLLTRFWGYYLPLEEQLLALNWPREMDFDYSTRRRVPFLERDLLALGETPETLARTARCANLPPLASFPQALGCLYVIEGSTLGGQVLARHLHLHLGLTPESGAAFFNGYGSETGPRWQAFGAWLTAAAKRAQADQEIIASANRVFETFEQWLVPTAKL